MSKWEHVSEKRKKEIFAFNKERAADKEKSEDLMTLLNALPPGQKRQLLSDKTCAAILHKYGISEEE